MTLEIGAIYRASEIRYPYVKVLDVLVNHQGATVIVVAYLDNKLRFRRAVSFQSTDFERVATTKI